MLRPADEALDQGDVALLARLLDKFRPTTLSDPFFGRLLYIRAAPGFQPYWEAVCWFAPTEALIDVSLDAVSKVHSSSQAQRDHFIWVGAEFTTICSAVEEELRREPWAERLLAVPFDQKFTLAGLSIPLCQNPDEPWDISFESAVDGLLLTATLRGSAVINLAVDS